MYPKANDEEKYNGWTIDPELLKLLISRVNQKDSSIIVNTEWMERVENIIIAYDEYSFWSALIKGKK